MKKYIIIGLSSLIASTSLFAGAVAGDPQKIQAGESFKLDGSDSFAEFGGDIKSYQWILLNKDGTTVNKPFKSSKSPILTLRLGADKFSSKYIFTLITKEFIKNDTIITKDTTLVNVFR